MTTATTTRKPRTIKAPHGTARLTLTINGAAYSARRIPIDPSIGHAAWRLRKSGTAECYDLAHLADGTLACDCPSQVWDHADHAEHPRCKHLAAAVAVGIL